MIASWTDSLSVGGPSPVSAAAVAPDGDSTPNTSIGRAVTGKPEIEGDVAESPRSCMAPCNPVKVGGVVWHRASVFPGTSPTQRSVSSRSCASGDGGDVGVAWSAGAGMVSFTRRDLGAGGARGVLRRACLRPLADLAIEDPQRRREDSGAHPEQAYVFISNKRV